MSTEASQVVSDMALGFEQRHGDMVKVWPGPDRYGRQRRAYYATYHGVSRGKARVTKVGTTRIRSVAIESCRALNDGKRRAIYGGAR